MLWMVTHAVYESISLLLSSANMVDCSEQWKPTTEVPQLYTGSQSELSFSKTVCQVKILLVFCYSKSLLILLSGLMFGVLPNRQLDKRFGLSFAGHS